MKSTLPGTQEELREFAQVCSNLKRMLVDHVATTFRDEVMRIAARHADRPSTDSLIEMDVVEDVLYTSRLRDGRTVIEHFLAVHPDLSDEEREILAAWKDPVLGVFHIQRRRGQLLEAQNLVDDLQYKLVCTEPDDRVLSKLSQGTYVWSRVVPLRDGWMLSGGQRLLGPSDEIHAYRIAAKIATRRPALFFRNPANLERGREADLRLHRVFLELADRPWFIGPPAEAEGMHNRVLLGGSRPESPTDTEEVKRQRKDSVELIGSFVLPPALRQAETVGIFSHPERGMVLTPDAGLLLEALEDPQLAHLEPWRTTLQEYLEADQWTPAALEVLAITHEEQMTELFRTFLSQPGFNWAEDGPALLRRRNPAFASDPCLPTSMPLNARLVAGEMAWNRTNSVSGQTAAIRKKRRGLKKGERARLRKKRK